MEINETKLASLRESVVKEMSEKRANHTLEVEKMAERLAKLYCPENEMLLRAAALLHDITKEYDTETQLTLCKSYGIKLTNTDIHATKTLHARTAAMLIMVRYPDFADTELIHCIRFHTTGRQGMTICEKLLYLADYIDMSRSFADCVELRDYFFSADFGNMTEEEKIEHLDRTILRAFDMTIYSLLKKGAPISGDTVRGRNELAIKLSGK